MQNTLTLTKNSHPCVSKSCFSGIFRFASCSDVPLLVMGSILIVLSAIASPMQTLLYGKIFEKLARFLSGDYDSVEHFLDDLRVLVSAMIAIAGGRLLFAWPGITIWLLVGENTQMNARTSLFKLLLHKDIEWLGMKENLIGSLTVFFRCIEEIRSGVSENLGLFVQTLASVCCLFVIAMISLWSLTLIICCLVPLLVLCSWVFGSLTSKYATEENLKNAQALKILDWCFNCGSSVRVLNGKFQDLVNFSRAVDASSEAFTNMAFAISVNSALLRLLNNLVVVGGLAFGEFLVRTHRLSLSNVITAFSACVLFGTEISSMGDIVALLNKAQASCNTIDTLDFEDSPVNTILPLLSTTRQYLCFSRKTPCLSLTLEKVTFLYANTAVNVIKTISLSFSSARMNFIVGESGSGKSTVALLLAGFLKRTQGNVLVDNVNFECLLSDWFFENMCFVELRSLVFERLLAENLLLGTDYDVTDERTKTLLKEACIFADLLKFVFLLPQQLDTIILSSKLSGGQIQKIGLARAWIANRPILILDEALGSINRKLKLGIMDRIRLWRQLRITILISHDLSDIQGGDSVVIMEKGKVKTKGLARDMRNLLPKLELTLIAKGFEEEEEEERPPAYDYITNPAVLKDLERSVPITETGTGGSIQKTDATGLFQIMLFCYRTTEYKILILLGLVCSLLSGIATPGLSYCVAEVLSLIVKNAVLASSETLSVVTWSLITVAVSMTDLVVTFGSHISLQYALEKWILTLRKRCLERINDQDMAFFTTFKPAYLNTLLMNDTRDLRHLVSEFLSGILLVVSLTLLGLIWAVMIGLKLALVGVSFVPLVLIVTMTYSFLLQKYETAYKDHVADLEKFSIEVVSAMRTVRSFGLSRQLSAEHQQKLIRLYTAGTKRAVAGGFGITLLDFCCTAATATVLYYGMFLIVHNEYTQRQMLQVLTILTFTVSSASYLMKLLPEISRGQRVGTLIMDILKLSELPVECGGALIKRASTKSDEPVFAFDNVCFSYPDAETNSFKPVLRNMNFKVFLGEALVMVGECGSGKSTITQLMLRLYMQDKGNILFQGIDVREYNPEWFRQNVALISQDLQFFEASIRENLLYGMTGSDRFTAATNIEDCLKAANAHEFTLKLPKKLETVLEKDYLFSLGQMQRLSIARMLLRKPKVMIFDEPTSHLDSENSARILSLIFDDLHHFESALTSIVISHDPRVVQRASRVLMLQKGAVVEEGKGGMFANFSS